MIARIRFDWSLPLVTVTELHVGTGQSRAANSAEINNGISCEIATYVRDNRGEPFIPGTTLKGAFRDGNKDASANELFGQPHFKFDRPPVFASTIVSFGAFLPQDTLCPPIVRLRTAVSGGTGASEANKLFAEEWVPPSTRLDARFRLEVRQRDARHGPNGGIIFPGESDAELEGRAERLRQAFEVHVARFCRPEGVAIAADKSDGMGRLRFDLKIFTEQPRNKIDSPAAYVQLKFERRELTTDGWSEARALLATCNLPSAASSLIEIPLACSGPYIARGGVRKSREGYDIREITVPERDASCLPRVHPSGVSGALRKRAEWLVALARRHDLTAYKDTMGVTFAGNRGLSVVQRLFGHEGWRGSLNIDVSGVSRKGISVYPFVALDPITQAPAKDALFKVETDFGVTAVLRISPFRRLLDGDETMLFAALTADIAANGLQLGGGSSRGWGWFNIRPTDPARMSAATRICPAPTEDLEKRLPDRRVTLPYRIIKADPSKVLMPEKPVTDRITARTLLSDPIPDGLCGWLDVSWCIETSILIGDGADPVSPQMLDGVPVLPGSTLRGMIRSIVETITQARFGKLNEKTSKASIGKKINASYPQSGAFAPDFAQALFGHVIEPPGTDQQQNRATHQEHHLKSRLAFGYAGLTNYTPQLIDRTARIMQLSSPNPNAVFYDEPGRKTYYATGGNASAVDVRLNANSRLRVNDRTTSLRFLNPPANDDPLVFRGRIRFHNVTTAELGALIWAVTMGGKPVLRHRIGHARAYGAGRGFADDLHLHIDRNDAKTPSPATEAEIQQFCLNGHSFVPALQAFGQLLNSKCLFHHQTVDEIRAAADPAIGDAIRRKASIADTLLAYQISTGFTGANAATATDIQSAQGGRLAAMLKPKP